MESNGNYQSAADHPSDEAAEEAVLVPPAKLQKKRTRATRVSASITPGDCAAPSTSTPTSGSTSAAVLPPVARRRTASMGSAFTHTPGFSFEAPNGVTTRTVAAICALAMRGFGQGYSIYPEPIAEGGLLIATWPGKQGNAYKSVRFHVRSVLGRWPDIRGGLDTYEEWRRSEPAVIWSGPQKGDRSPQCAHSTYLKAMHGAPCWTKGEVHKIAEAFESVGLIVQKQSLRKLTAKALVDHGELGDPV
jgi:hypothetical protein